MKNIKEAQPILTAIYCLNRTNENEDKTIRLILDYAFRRLFGANTNLLTLCCVGKTYAQMYDEVLQLLKRDTDYEKYLEEILK